MNTETQKTECTKIENVALSNKVGVLASCINCKWNMDQSDGPEYGGAWYACEKPGNEYMGNLNGFPFKTPQKCCDLSFVHMIDWEKEAAKQRMQSEDKSVDYGDELE